MFTEVTLRCCYGALTGFLEDGLRKSLSSRECGQYSDLTVASVPCIPSCAARLHFSLNLFVMVYCQAHIDATTLSHNRFVPRAKRSIKDIALYLPSPSKITHAVTNFVCARERMCTLYAVFHDFLVTSRGCSHGHSNTGSIPYAYRIMVTGNCLNAFIYQQMTLQGCT